MLDEPDAVSARAESIADSWSTSTQYHVPIRMLLLQIASLLGDSRYVVTLGHQGTLPLLRNGFDTAFEYRLPTNPMWLLKVYLTIAKSQRTVTAQVFQRVLMVCD